MFGVRRIRGIPYNQKINENEIQGRVLRLKAFNSNKLQEGDYVVVPNSKNADYLWGAKSFQLILKQKSNLTVNDAFEGEEEIVSFLRLKEFMQAQSFWPSSIFFGQEMRLSFLC